MRYPALPNHTDVSFLIFTIPRTLALGRTSHIPCHNAPCAHSTSRRSGRSHLEPLYSLRVLQHSLAAHLSYFSSFHHFRSASTRTHRPVPRNLSSSYPFSFPRARKATAMAQHSSIDHQRIPYDIRQVHPLSQGWRAERQGRRSRRFIRRRVGGERSGRRSSPMGH